MCVREREDYKLEWCRIASVTFRRLYRLFPVEEVNGKLKNPEICLYYLLVCVHKHISTNTHKHTPTSWLIRVEGCEVNQRGISLGSRFGWEYTCRTKVVVSRYVYMIDKITMFVSGCTVCWGR